MSNPGNSLPLNPDNRPERLPLDLEAEAHISADGSSFAYRRGLERLGLGQFFSA